MKVFIKMIVNFVYISALIAFITATIPDLPKYIKKCSFKSVNFRQCAIQSGNEAIPYLVKGDRSFGIPPMNPLRIPFVGLESNTFQVNITDFVFSGAENFVVENILVNWDVDPKRANTTLSNNFTTIEFNYVSSGKLSIFSLKGRGHAKVEMINTIFAYWHDFIMETRGGLSYIVFGKDGVMFEPEKIHINFDGLFNGNQKLTEYFNEFLNNNWRDFKEELTADSKKVFGSVFRNILEKFSSVPYDNWFTN